MTLAVIFTALVSFILIYNYSKERKYGKTIPKYKIISLDGNIGAGKTTLLNMLKRHITNMKIKNIHIIKEPVDLWERTGILNQFYKDKKKVGGFFQLFVLETLIDALRNKINELSGGGYNIIITERSIESTRHIFAKMLRDDNIITEEEMKCYLYVYESSENKKFIPNSIIYLNTPPDICAERIVERGREGENSIESSYLEKTNNYYENMIKSIKERGRQQLLEINYNEYDIKSEGFCNKIIRFIDTIP
jgi:deoxyadenosine/deoxycytidine kinase